jgi:transcriptional regulator with XRE-family HTH domain
MIAIATYAIDVNEMEPRLKYWRMQKGLTQTQLGEMSGLGQFTIHKIEAGKQELRLRHLPVLARPLGIRPVDLLPEDLLDGADISPIAPHMAEASRFDADADGVAPHIKAMITALLSHQSDLEPWVLNSQSLERKGHNTGDILIVDPAAKPHDGDIVCARMANHPAPIFRIYNPPFLMSASVIDAQPLLIGSAGLTIHGPIVDSLRAR